MGERSLFDMFLETEIDDLKLVLLRYGIDGLMNEFESWLRRNELIDTQKEDDFRGYTA